jgi:hypothetical protein
MYKTNQIKKGNLKASMKRQRKQLQSIREKAKFKVPIPVSEQNVLSSV